MLCHIPIIHVLTSQDSWRARMQYDLKCILLKRKSQYNLKYVYILFAVFIPFVLLTLLNNVKICHYITCISAVLSISLSIFIILFALLCIFVSHFSAWFIEICKWLGINVPRNPDNTVKHFKCSINPLKWFELLFGNNFLSEQFVCGCRFFSFRILKLKWSPN